MIGGAMGSYLLQGILADDVIAAHGWVLGGAFGGGGRAEEAQ